MFLEGGPDWSYLDKAMPAMVASLQMAWIGTIIGATLSLPLGFLGAKNVVQRLGLQRHAPDPQRHPGLP